MKNKIFKAVSGRTFDIENLFGNEWEVSITEITNISGEDDSEYWTIEVEYQANYVSEDEAFENVEDEFTLVLITKSENYIEEFIETFEDDMRHQLSDC